MNERASTEDTPTHSKAAPRGRLTNGETQEETERGLSVSFSPSLRIPSNYNTSRRHLEETSLASRTTGHGSGGARVAGQDRTRQPTAQTQRGAAVTTPRLHRLPQQSSARRAVAPDRLPASPPRDLGGVLGTPTLGARPAPWPRSAGGDGLDHTAEHNRAVWTEHGRECPARAWPPGSAPGRAGVSRGPSLRAAGPRPGGQSRSTRRAGKGSQRPRPWGRHPAVVSVRVL